MDGQKGIVTDRHLGVAHGVDMVRERHPVPTHRHDRQAHLKGRVFPGREGFICCEATKRSLFIGQFLRKTFSFLNKKTIILKF